MKRAELAQRIDHTLLGPKATREGVETLCQEALEVGAASVCVDPCFAGVAHEIVKGSPVKVCIVIGFPSGMTTSEAKAFEAKQAMDAGAEELDMVVNVGALTSGDHDTVRRDIEAVCRVAHAARPKATVKVILETALLSDDEKVAGAKITKEAGADFVKTSTGFGPGGATVEDVALLRKTVGNDTGVKAAGGIRDYETAIAMLDAGATRIGASRTLAILDGAES
jgi:deoxyribose-phosphate aldolase